MSGFKATSFSAILGCVSALSGCGPAPARSEPPPPKVSIAHPQTRDLVDYDSYNGWLDAPATVEVRARVRGHIDKVNFADGDLVKKDQVLFELDPRPFQSDVARATEQLAIFRSQSVAADREETRLKDLLKKGGASQTQVDKAEADAASLKASIEAQTEEIKRKQLDLDYSRITAPIAGRIGRALLTVGNLVNAGGSDPVLATIVAVDPMYIYFYVDERSLQRLQKTKYAGGASTLREAKMPFNFGLETDEGYPYEGTLDFADNKVDPTTGTILVRGTTSNDKRLLVPGSRVKVRVPLSKPHQSLLVPDTAILSDQDKKYVLVVDDKNVVARRDVTMGKLLDDGMRVILPAAPGEPGLETNDWIVTQGLQSARINYPVDPIKPTSQPSTQPVAGAL
jgi:RND family efflux transporter MFP subunit